MGYEPYADPVFYQETYKGNTIPEDDLEQALLQASRHVDSLTYNRIVGQGFPVLLLFSRKLYGR